MIYPKTNRPVHVRVKIMNINPQGFLQGHVICIMLLAQWTPFKAEYTSIPKSPISRTRPVVPNILICI